MKSNRQRRQEIEARRAQRAATKARRASARPVDRPVGTVVAGLAAKSRGREHEDHSSASD